MDASAATQQWTCPMCRTPNAPRDRCFRCKAARPAIAAAAAASCDARGAWREALDPAQRQMYYVNTVTGESTWSRPAELGPAPYASGWFGRGSVTSGAAQAALAARNERWLGRPARKQAEVDHTRTRVEGANEYNIWYGRYVGDLWRGGMGKDAAPSRCDPERDAGRTRATLAMLGDRCYFCIHFARGACSRGAECTFLHHVPTAEDDGALDAARDVFGRARHGSLREDMGGVGSMLSDSRTLYVGGLRRPPALRSGDEDEDARGPAAKPAPVGLVAAWESAVQGAFGVWGELENVNVITRLACAFVRYRCRANAEFALIAMANQSVGHGEVLNLRWAHDDPNPVAREARERADADAVTAALAARGVVFAPLGAPEAAAGGGAGEGAGMGVDGAAGGTQGPAPALQDSVAEASAPGGAAASTAASAAPAPPATAPAASSESQSPPSHAFTGADAASFLTLASGEVLNTRAPLPPALGSHFAPRAPTAARVLPPPESSHSAGAAGQSSAAAPAPAPALPLPQPPAGASIESAEYAQWYAAVLLPHAAAAAAAAAGVVGTSALRDEEDAADYRIGARRAATTRKREREDEAGEGGQ